jgi:predicted nuclease of predicted toxin-antitoxin system
MAWKPLTYSQRELDAGLKRFREKAIFYLDESIGPAIAEILERLGYKVRTAANCGMLGHSDADHAALCWREGMILVTHDRDFLNDRVVPEHRNPGVVVLDVDEGAAAAYHAVYFMAWVVGPFGKNWRRSKFLITDQGEIAAWTRNASTGAIKKTRYRWLPKRDIEVWADDPRGPKGK